MPKSEFAAGLDDALDQVTPFLKPLGFRKSGRAYNRVGTDRIVHVIGFQMGQFPIGDYAVSGLRESFYGKFAVNLGVHVPCVFEVERAPKSKKVFQDYDCQIRARLSSTPGDGADRWWEIKPPYLDLGRDVAALIGSAGIPFLDQFVSYRSILAFYEAHGRFPFQNTGRSALEAAILYRAIGDAAKSMAAFKSARSDAAVGRNPRFADHVATIEARLAANANAQSEQRET